MLEFLGMISLYFLSQIVEKLRVTILLTEFRKIKKRVIKTLPVGLDSNEQMGRMTQEITAFFVSCSAWSVYMETLEKKKMKREDND